MSISNNKASGLSPGRRAWLRFKANRRGFVSLWIFSVLFVCCFFAEVLSNDKPLLVNYDNEYYFPVLKAYPETTFGGDFETEADYTDGFVRDQLTRNGNWMIEPPIPYSYDTINFVSDLPNPAPQSGQNFLGTDDRGRDVLARVI